MPAYQFDPRLGRGTGRYVAPNGRIVKNSVVRDELDLLLGNAGDPMTTLFDLLRERQISLADFRLQGMDIIKDVHLNAVAMQRGGWSNMTQADYGRAGQATRVQYGYWRDMVDQIATGKQPIDGRLKLRMNMYVQAGRETFNASQASYATSYGATHVGSTLNPADHCSECVAFDGKWFVIGDSSYKKVGSRICLKNCRCEERHGVMKDGKIVELKDSEAVDSLEVV